MAVASYGSSTDSSGVVRILKDLDAPIEGRDVLIVEDIVDSGLTLQYLLRTLEARQPGLARGLRAADQARAAQDRDLPARYIGFEIPNRFAIGYGLDHAERYRNLPYVAALTAWTAEPLKQDTTDQHCSGSCQLRRKRSERESPLVALIILSSRSHPRARERAHSR